MNGRSQKFKVKLLMSGYLTNAHSIAGIVANFRHNVTEGKDETASEGTVTS